MSRELSAVTYPRALSRVLRTGASLGALCVAGWAGPSLAQTATVPADQTQLPNAPLPTQTQSPTGAVAGQGTAGAATQPTAQIGTDTTASTTDTTQAASGVAGTDDVVVTGIRQSLANAQNIKRNSDTVVDAITATDIGALPDRSVTEALQRVPGVSIERFSAANDPDHFSVEGAGVNIRGLNFVRSEFNGRDAFSAGVGGQSLNFATVPAELLGSVEVFKNVTAENIEGGLAGTVNLNTRKPFDNKGFHVAFDAEGNYGDFEKKWSPTGSILVSDTWNTGIGTFGLLGDVSYSRIRSRADGIQVTNFQTRDNNLALLADQGSNYTCRNPLPSNTDTSTLPAANSGCGTAQTAGADGFADYLGTAYAPVGGQFRTQDFDTQRRGLAFAGQWESNDGKALLTAQFLRNRSTTSWGEYTFETAANGNEYQSYPAGCLQNGDGPTNVLGTTVRAECPAGQFQNYTYNSSNLFQKGLITSPGTGYRSACDGGDPSQCFVPTGGAPLTFSRGQNRDTNVVTDYGLNMKLKPTSHLDINLDFDYTKSHHDVLDFRVAGGGYADESVDITGNLPVVVPQKPLTLAASWNTPNPALVADTNSQYFHDARVQYWAYAIDHIEHSDGREIAPRIDVAYKFDDGFLRDVKFGARYADRDETVRYSNYNWGALSQTWAGTNPVSISQSPANSAFFAFPDFFRGATPGPTGAYYYTGNLISAYDQAASYFQSIGNTWTTTNGAAGVTTWTPAAARAGVIPGTSFLPSEIQPVSDQTVDLYGQVDFGRNQTNLFGVRISGNAGLRFASTDITSGGSIGAPTQQQLGIAQPFSSINCTPSIPAGAPAGTIPTVNPICSLGAAGYATLQQFANGLTTPNVARNHYDYLLPSVNLKLGLSNDVLVRLAASKVLTKPELSDIRNFITTTLDTTSGSLQSTAGNPFLKPATAWQFDATFEWYFARVGSLTVDAFYKSVHNFFYSSLTTRNITSNGVTLPTLVRGPANYDGYGKIKGVEAAYQQSFTFLPGLLKGFGTNLNYTYIDSSGLPNSFLSNGLPTATSTVVPKGNLPLEGLSHHNVNAELFYERGRFSLRAAYNWRSKFLLTATDVIFPYYSIYQGAGGQLDASGFINITKQVKIGVQGVNLNNQVTKTLQSYTGDPNVLAPRSYFVNDRRFSFILRGNF